MQRHHHLQPPEQTATAEARTSATGSSREPSLGADVRAARVPDPVRGPVVAERVDPEAAADAHRLLEIYLDDRRAACDAALVVARRCARANAGTKLGERLTSELIPHLVEQRRITESVAATLGISVSGTKSVLARLAAAVGRLKPNGRVFAYSPLSRVLELEALIASLSLIERQWLALQRPWFARARLDTDEMADLATRAATQRAHLVAHHDVAVVAAFGGVARSRG